MEPLCVLSSEVFKIITQNCKKIYSLEDLVTIIMLRNNTSSEKEWQARVLDALILLSDKGLIILNPDTDESSMAINCLKNKI